MTFAGMNYWAVLMAAVAAWMLGALWYSMLAKWWMEAAGVTNPRMEYSARAFLPYVIAFVAALVMAWVLAGIMGHLGRLTIKNGVISGAFCWLGRHGISTGATGLMMSMRRRFSVPGASWIFTVERSGTGVVS